MAVTLQDPAWLLSTSLQADTRSYIEDLPFDGENFFSATKVIMLQELKKSIKPSITRAFLFLNLAPLRAGLGLDPGPSSPSPSNDQSNPDLTRQHSLFLHSWDEILCYITEVY